MKLREAIGPGARLSEMFPVAAAAFLNAVAHERWLLAAPALVLLGFVALRRMVVVHGPGGLLVSGVVGGLAGALMLLVKEPPPGPIPAALLSVITGVLLALALFCAASREMLYAWIYAWLLAIVSLHGKPTPLLLGALGLLAFGTIAAGLARTRMWRLELTSLVAVTSFVALLGGGTALLARSVQVSEGVLVTWIGGSLARMFAMSPSAGGIALQDDITLAPHSSIERNDTPLFELTGAAPLRLRTNVLDQYDGWTWRTSRALANRQLDPARPPADGPVKAFALTPLEPLGDVLPVPAGVRSATGVRVRFTGGWAARSEALEGRAVAMTTDAFGQLLPEEPPGPSLLSLPEVLVTELTPFAQEIVPAAGDTRSKARAVEAFFTDHFEYTLDSNLIGHGHPLTVLIRERRPAYCIYFASAMAALLRVSRISARVVGGFVVVEQNPLTGDALVRGRDAHAWVEVWIPEAGRYETFDPTPSASRDASLQIDRTPGLVASALRALAAGIRHEFGRFKRSPSDFLLHSPAVWAFLVGVLVWQVRRRRLASRTSGPRAAQRSGDPQLEKLYAGYLKLLARGADLRPRAAETDDELVARLAAARGATAAQAADTFLAAYRAARYRRPTSEAPALSRPLEALEEALRRAG